MKCIIGLGNPGQKYEHTRHNIGYRVIDFFRKEYDFPEWKSSRFQGVISEGMFHGEKIILLKPETYMNLSGESVASIVHFYKLDPKRDILVISDDLDMEFGKIRYREKGSSGGQRGIQSIIDCLGTSEFPRIKVGIGRSPDIPVIQWVVSNFSNEEESFLETVFPIFGARLASAFQ